MRDSPRQCGKQRAATEKHAWFLDVSPDDRVGGVAMRSLEQRLALVQKYLPLTVERADEDEKCLHRLRVGAGRAVAAINLYHHILPQRQVSMIKADLQQILRAARDVADYDLLISRFCSDKGRLPPRCFAEKLQSGRCRARQRIVAIHEDLGTNDCFQRDVSWMLDQLRQQEKRRDARHEQPFGEWSRPALRATVKRFFRSEPNDWTNVPALNKLRLRGAALRYAMELLGATFPSEFCNELYPIVARVQSRLGKIKEHATTLTRAGDWFEEARDSTHRDFLMVLLADERLRLDQSRDAFASWWKPQRGQMRKCFAEMLASSAAGDVRTAGGKEGLDILVADDSLVCQTIALRLLVKEHHRVTVAADGKEAVRLFASRGFDLVLMDIEMPEMDGLEAARIIRRIESPTSPRVPIIAVTSESRDGIQAECLSAGMDDFLAKPLRAEPFSAAVDAVFHRPALGIPTHHARS